MNVNDITELITHTLSHTFSDNIRILPFLFAAFLLLEILEHQSGGWVHKIMTKFQKTGPFIGAVIGCIPQCGFSVMASNLYAGRMISVGTLLSVFLATSDEALLIMLGHPGNERDTLLLIAAKIIIAAAAGYLTDAFLKDRIQSDKKKIHIKDHSGCHSHQGIIRSVLIHTAGVFLYIFIFSGILNFLIELFGLDAVTRLFLNGSILQPFLAALVGLIPNCAASVLLAELYLNGALSFSALIAGLCTNAGVGLLTLFKVNKDVKENLKITGLLYLTAIIASFLLFKI